MALSRLEDFEASSRRSFGEHVLMHFEVYSSPSEKAGQVVDILVDEAGHCQYLVIDFSNKMTGRQVLLPYHECQVDQATRRVYFSGLDQIPVAELTVYNSIENNRVECAFENEVTSSSCQL